MGRTGSDKARPAKDKEREKASKEQMENRERRLEARAISQSLKDNDGLGAASVAGEAAAASIRGQGSKSKDITAVGSPPRKERSEGEKSAEPDTKSRNAVLLQARKGPQGTHRSAKVLGVTSYSAEFANTQCSKASLKTNT